MNDGEYTSIGSFKPEHQKGSFGVLNLPNVPNFFQVGFGKQFLVTFSELIYSVKPPNLIYLVEK